MKCWSLLAVAALAVLAPAEAAAFQRSVVQGTQVCLFWEDRNLPWSLNDRGSEEVPLDQVQAALRSSYATWEAVDCSDMQFAERPLTGATSVGYDRNEGTSNLVIFRDEGCEDVVASSDPCWADDSCGNTFDCWPPSWAGVIAITTTSYRQDTGQIVDADIEFNGAKFDFTTADGPPCEAGSLDDCVSTDLENTATHEIGHVLGIDHTRVSGATMFASAPLGETDKRSLARDDIDAICTIYPLGESANVCEDAYGIRVDDGGGCGCTNGSGAAGAGWILAGAGLLGWRRRAG